MPAAQDIMIQLQKILNNLGTPIEQERDPKIGVALRPYLCYIRDELTIANKAFLIKGHKYIIMYRGYEQIEWQAQRKENKQGKVNIRRYVLALITWNNMCRATENYTVRRAALRKLIDNDYNRYMKELRKYDSAITRTQP